MHPLSLQLVCPGCNIALEIRLLLISARGDIVQNRLYMESSEIGLGAKHFFAGVIEKYHAGGIFHFK